MKDPFFFFFVAIRSGGDGPNVFPILGTMDETNWTNLYPTVYQLVISCSSVSKS